MSNYVLGIGFSIGAGYLALSGDGSPIAIACSAWAGGYMLCYALLQTAIKHGATP